MTQIKCLVCMRGEKFFDGCSHIDCPNRTSITARPVGDLFLTPASGIDTSSIVSDGLRRESGITESE